MNALSTILPYLPYGYLLAVLLIATFTDVKFRRIPNVLTFSTMLVALLVYTLMSGWSGMLFSLKGLACGFGVLLLPYLLGGMGAGDVKLMASVGAVLGAADTLIAFLVIALLGGVVSVAALILRGELLGELKRLWNAFCGMFGGLGIAALRVDRPTLEREGLPYGAVIAVGTVAFEIYRFIIGGQGLPPAPL